MKIRHKYSISLAVLLIAIAIIVVEVLERAPDYSKKSPSGQYLIESVPASSLLTPRDFVYLRFTDLNNPSQVYRTPLFPSWSWICAPMKMKNSGCCIYRL